jgi:prevent-host-death family protein
MLQSQWTVLEAKANFSEFLDRARSRGPQTITCNGKHAAVIVSAEEWERKSRRVGNLAEFCLPPRLCEIPICNWNECTTLPDRQTEEAINSHRHTAFYFAASSSSTITRSTSSGCGSGNFSTSPPLTALNSTLLPSRSSRAERTGRGIAGNANTGPFQSRT